MYFAICVSTVQDQMNHPSSATGVLLTEMVACNDIFQTLSIQVCKIICISVLSEQD